MADPLAIRVCLIVALSAGTFLRVWKINALGYNSDEAVYAGQGASLANLPELTPYFPIIRAHPMIFQFLLALTYHWGYSDWTGRLLSAFFGMATIFLVYRIGRLLYSSSAGAIAALFMALMPYHVIVTRQVLLDGPATFCTTLTLYLIAKFASTGRPWFLAATGTALGLSFMTKETAFVVFAAVYTFLALSSEIRVRIRDIVLSFACMFAVMFLYPVSLKLAGGGASEKAQGYLVWQLFRRPNHGWDFYPRLVPPAMGLAVIALALLGFVILRRERTWRETLLVAWIVVPIVVFQLWPVKGFQYLLPTAPPIAILAGRTIGLGFERLNGRRLPRLIRPAVLQTVVVIAVAISLAIPAWGRAQPSQSTSLLAGSGGMPGGREAGAWIDANIPLGAVFMTVGPSMANVIQFYGHREAYGLSVSTNPLHRNPSYEPIYNPDLRIRNSELQYLVYDTFSASRSSFFGDKMIDYAKKYNGRIVHQEYVTQRGPDGHMQRVPVITIYEVRPSVNTTEAPPESAEPALESTPGPGGNCPSWIITANPGC
jgi:4-amino-4-deoxy-L-arabinose transferase-like glycosyltransferase